jgi:hypothetical protein
MGRINGRFTGKINHVTLGSLLTKSLVMINGAELLITNGGREAIGK